MAEKASLLWWAIVGEPSVGQTSLDDLSDYHYITIKVKMLTKQTLPFQFYLYNREVQVAICVLEMIMFGLYYSKIC